MEAKKESTKNVQCKWCIQVLQGEVRYARHIATKHPEKVEEYVTGDRMVNLEELKAWKKRRGR